MSDEHDLEATCRCTECGDTFTTPANADGKIKFDGIREHGVETQHERWNYEIVDRPGGDDA